MMRRTFTDDELHTASVAVINAMLRSFDELPEYEYEFSDAYKAKMEELLRKIDRRRKLESLGKNVAAVFAAVLIGLTSWIAFDVDARAAFFDWVREVYENSVVYRYFGEKEPETLPQYELGWLPEGFEEVFRKHDTSGEMKYYVNAGTGAGIGFEYRCLDEKSIFEINSLYSEDLSETVIVNSFLGDYYPATEKSPSNTLLWID